MREADVSLCEAEKRNQVGEQTCCNILQQRWIPGTTLSEAMRKHYMFFRLLWMALPWEQQEMSSLGPALCEKHSLLPTFFQWVSVRLPTVWAKAELKLWLVVTRAFVWWSGTVRCSGLLFSSGGPLPSTDSSFSSPDERGWVIRYLLLHEARNCKYCYYHFFS